MNRNLYVYTKGRLVRKDNTMRFIEEGGDKHDIPVEQVSDIYIMTQMDFNTEFLNLASHSGIALHFYNYYDNISLGETTKKQNKYLGNINKIIFLLKVKFFLTPNISYDIISSWEHKLGEVCEKTSSESCFWRKNAVRTD